MKAASALALAGAPDDAEGVLRRLRNVRPDDTLLQSAYLPVAESALLLARGRSDAAIEVLRRASQYELGTVAALTPAQLRGEAHLRSGAAQQALDAFRSVAGHRGVDPFSPVIPLAYLGQARAFARDRAIDNSRKAYEELLGMWESADADLRVLRQAREELSRLMAGTSGPH